MHLTGVNGSELNWKDYYLCRDLCLFCTIYFKEVKLRCRQLSSCGKWKKRTKCVWKEAGAGEENGTESGQMQLEGETADYLVSSCSVRVFLAMVEVRSSGFGSNHCFWLMVWRWRRKQMEDYSWPNCLCPANTPPSAERGSLRLSPAQQKPALSSAAVVWVWLMLPSLTFTSHRSSRRFTVIPCYRFACHGRIIHCDIIMEYKTHKVNINLLIFNRNFCCRAIRHVIKGRFRPAEDRILGVLHFFDE